MINTILALLITFTTSYAFASATPGSFTFQGKVFAANGVDPIENSSVQFKIQIRSPD